MTEQVATTQYFTQDEATGITLHREKFYPQHTKDPDGYDVWTVLFVPQADTLDFDLYCYIDGVGEGKERWAACEVYLQIDEQPRMQLYTQDDDDFDTYTFQFDRDKFYNYYNGQNLKFIVREKNRHATVTSREIHVERFWFG